MEGIQKPSRVNYEMLALEPFEDILRKHGIQGFTKQVKENRIPLSGNTYFQFGDLRVETDNEHLVIEVESAGGVTNLTKYWYALDKGLIKKPVTLMHIFKQNSDNDFDSHLQLWEFISQQMKVSLGIKFKSQLFTYRTHMLRESLTDALTLFEVWLSKHKL